MNGAGKAAGGRQGGGARPSSAALEPGANPPPHPVSLSVRRDLFLLAFLVSHRESISTPSSASLALSSLSPLGLWKDSFQGFKDAGHPFLLHDTVQMKVMLQREGPSKVQNNLTGIKLGLHTRSMRIMERVSYNGDPGVGDPAWPSLPRSQPIPYVATMAAGMTAED